MLAVTFLLHAVQAKKKKKSKFLDIFRFAVPRLHCKKFTTEAWVEWGSDKMGMTNYISNGKSPISARTNPRSLVMVPVGYWAGDGINHRALQV